MLFEFNLQIEYDIILLKNSVVKIKWKKNFYQSIFTYDIFESIVMVTVLNKIVYWWDQKWLEGRDLYRHWIWEMWIAHQILRARHSSLAKGNYLHHLPKEQK